MIYIDFLNISSDLGGFVVLHVDVAQFHINSLYFT